jgi:hypothetical protein
VQAISAKSCAIRRPGPSQLPEAARTPQAARDHLPATIALPHCRTRQDGPLQLARARDANQGAAKTPPTGAERRVDSWLYLHRDADRPGTCMVERPEVNSVNFQGFFNLYSKNSKKAQTIDSKGFIVKVYIYIKYINCIIGGGGLENSIFKQIRLNL